jgi:arginine:ornithine antiporter/lysine permease
MKQKKTKLGLSMLVTLVIGSMIGGGIFSLPQNMASGAGVGAILIGWLITALGMLSLAFVFQNLANRQPQLDAGVYVYAKAGFGSYVGFSSAWGYWLSGFVGNVGYLVLIFGTLGYFFPIFGEGNTLWAIVGASVVLWLVHALILLGIKEAALVNQITTLAKLIPLILFIVVLSLSFNSQVFTSDFWGKTNPQLGSVFDQVRSVMLVSVWVFIGIEGASVYSAHAKKRSHVGYATVIGFLFTLMLLVAINVLSMGVMSQAELAQLKNPSMAYVLERVVGSWGAVLINLGLLVSLSGALLSWTLLSAEILYMSAQDKTMPRFLAKQNRKGVPVQALWVTNGMIQFFLILTLFSNATYLALVYLASSMILLPYLLSAAYAMILVIKGQIYQHRSNLRIKDAFVAVLAVVYSVWLIYGGGVKYLLLSALLYLPGIFFFVKARREQGLSLLTRTEWIIFLVVLLGAVVAACGLWTGWLKVSI